jgi:hypothetical protein
MVRGLLFRGSVAAALIAVLAVPAAVGARASASARAGLLVVRKAVGDGGINGHPVVTVVVRGFVRGRVSQDAKVEIYHPPSVSGQGVLVTGRDVSTTSVRWHGLLGKRYSGTRFRFRTAGGLYRVVVRGSGVFLVARGRGHVTLQGSSVFPRADGTYSIDRGAFRSMPTQPVERRIG